MYYKALSDMNNPIAAASRKTTFSLSNLDGGAEVVRQSSQVNYTGCSGSPVQIVPLEKSNCSVSIRENSLGKKIKLKVFPNPFSKMFN